MLLLIVFDKFQLGFTTRAIKIAILISSSPEAIHITLQYIHYICTNSYFFNFLENPRSNNAQHVLILSIIHSYLYKDSRMVWWHVNYFGWRTAREKNLVAKPRGFCETSRYILNRYTCKKRT